MGSCSSKVQSKQSQLQAILEINTPMVFLGGIHSWFCFMPCSLHSHEQISLELMVPKLAHSIATKVKVDLPLHSRNKTAKTGSNQTAVCRPEPITDGRGPAGDMCHFDSSNLSRVLTHMGQSGEAHHHPNDMTEIRRLQRTWLGDSPKTPLLEERCLSKAVDVHKVFKLHWLEVQNNLAPTI